MASTSTYIRNFRTQIPGELVIGETFDTWYFPTINSVNRHGRGMFWKIYVRCFRPQDDQVTTQIDENAFVHIEDSFFDSKPLEYFGWISVDSGVTGGKIKKSVPTIVTTGKNIGKLSQTNTWTQALRDAYGLYNKQMKKAVSNTHTVELYPPMLAQLYIAQKKPLIIDAAHQVFIQRKYNGVRAIATLDCNDLARGVIMYSRRKNIYPGMAHIKAELLGVLTEYCMRDEQIYLDGEIYKHGALLQDISGIARAEEAGGVTTDMDFMVYDCFIPSTPGLIYSERLAILNKIFETPFTHVKQVKTFEILSAHDIDTYYKTFTDEGYEGAMLRVNTKYQPSYNEHHSKALLKLKQVFDAEYEIVDFAYGEKGKAASALMIICATADGLTFPVTPAMELKERIALGAKMAEIESNGQTHFANHWKGKHIIIEYDELSRDKVPQRARTRLSIRTWD